MSVDNQNEPGMIPVDKFNPENLRDHPNALEVPAAQGKESVRILPNAAYFKANHGQYMVEYAKDADWPTQRPTKDAYYAMYLFETTGGEKRFITVPVALGLGSAQYDQKLLSDMEKQGFDPREVQEHADVSDVEEVFGYLNTRQLPDLRQMMEQKSFVTSGYHHRFGGTVTSGWRSTPSLEELNIVGEEMVVGTARMNPYFSNSPTERYPTLLHAISKPLDPNTTNPLEKEIYSRVLKANSVAAGK